MVKKMEHCNQCILQINLAYQKNENPGVVTKSKCLIGEYNKIKGMHNAEVRCYSIPHCIHLTLSKYLLVLYALFEFLLQELF